MSLYIQPDKPLTPEEKLLAAVIDLSQRIPCGGQICMDLSLASAMARVEAFFTEHHQLPHKDELVAELILWKEHAGQGLKFSQQCDHLMQEVVRVVASKVKE